MVPAGTRGGRDEEEERGENRETFHAFSVGRL